MLFAIPLALAAGLAVGHSTEFNNVVRDFSSHEYIATSLTEPSQIVLNVMANACVRTGGQAIQETASSNEAVCVIDNVRLIFSAQLTADNEVRFVVGGVAPIAHDAVFNACRDYGGHAVPVSVGSLDFFCMFDDDANMYVSQSRVAGGMMQVSWTAVIPVSAIERDWYAGFPRH